MLARAMARYVDPNSSGPVVELGPGTGPVTEALVAAGVEPIWHARIPPNDGGISVGQVLATARVKTRARLDTLRAGEGRSE
jgi:hypothetical protein